MRAGQVDIVQVDADASLEALARGSCWPTPRMNAVRVELVARDALSVVFGSARVRAVMSGMPCLEIWSALKAVTETGTSCSVSSRRRAVTTTTFALSTATAAGAALVSVCACRTPTEPPIRAMAAATERFSNFNLVVVWRMMHVSWFFY
ncbi:hypothetical protein LP420_04480 [Massilia sp. B-10]|nr:hypothetical protein LP420_04480 [Massilia sp. B-10]